MPEGDAVRRTARRLDTALAGQRLVRADLRVPRFATLDLAGAEVLGTEVMGKHLLTRLRRGADAITLHSHLRMDGRWATGAAGPRPVAGPAYQIRVWLVTELHQAVGLRLAMTEVLATTDEARLVGHLGPDILADSFDSEAAADRVAAQGGRPLGESLLDQTVLSGLGTIWTAETAFHARVSPWTACRAVPGLAVALAATRGDMQCSLSQPRVRYAVYGRRGQPCRVCGTVISSGRLGAPPTDRITFWCAYCQPGPAARGVAPGR